MIPIRFIKPIILSTVALAIVPIVTAARAAMVPAFEEEMAGSYDIDAGHSAVMFRIKHMGVAYNYGRFNEMSGKYVLAAEVGKSSFEITVPAASIDTNSEKRDDHLKSPDFFNVKQYPEISFKSSKFVKKDDDSYAVTGELSLHGETKEITVDMEFTGARDTGQRGFRSGLECTFTINRRDYGIDTYPDEALGNEVTMTIGIEGIRK